MLSVSFVRQAVRSLGFCLGRGPATFLARAMPLEVALKLRQQIFEQAVVFLFLFLYLVTE